METIEVKTIISLDNLEDLKVQFTCKDDPLSDGPSELTFHREDFIELQASTPILFKLAVNQSKELKSGNLPVSLRY